MSLVRNRYIDLLKKCVLDNIYKNQKDFYRKTNATEDEIVNGIYYPDRAHTMIGEERLNNIQNLMEYCINNNIPGDFIETGVWRGGATIFMAGILQAYSIKDRKVFVADSFEGLPLSVSSYPIDVKINSKCHTIEYLKVSQQEVEDNFKAYDLLDDNVVFIKGYFEHSLVNAPIDQLALLRLDGDMYSSTIQVFNILYDKVSIGGYIIIDDWTLPGAKAATLDFRKSRNIHDPIIEIPLLGKSKVKQNQCCYWKKST